MIIYRTLAEFRCRNDNSIGCDELSPNISGCSTVDIDAVAVTEVGGIAIAPKASDVATAEEGEERSCNIVGVATRRILYPSRVFPNKTMLGIAGRCLRIVILKSPLGTT